jgi:hypothetical protein
MKRRGWQNPNPTSLTWRWRWRWRQLHLIPSLAKGDQKETQAASTEEKAYLQGIARAGEDDARGKGNIAKCRRGGSVRPMPHTLENARTPSGPQLFSTIFTATQRRHNWRTSCPGKELNGEVLNPDGSDHVISGSERHWPGPRRTITTIAEVNP